MIDLFRKMHSLDFVNYNEIFSLRSKYIPNSCQPSSLIDWFKKKQKNLETGLSDGKKEKYIL